MPRFPKPVRHTLGGKIDSLFIEIVELVLTASRLSKNQKLPLVDRASIKLDALKFFLEIAWEIKLLDNRKYIFLSEKLDEIGRMLGGWLKNLEQKLPRHNVEGEQGE